MCTLVSQCGSSDPRLSNGVECVFRQTPDICIGVSNFPPRVWLYCGAIHNRMCFSELHVPYLVTSVVLLHMPTTACQEIYSQEGGGGRGWKSVK